MTNITRRADGSIAAWKHEEGDTYTATGVDYNGKRVAARTSPNWAYIACVNIYRGAYWCNEKRTGKRIKIMNVTN